MDAPLSKESAAFRRDFAAFFSERVRPVVDDLAVRRRRTLKTSAIAAGVVFVVFFIATYLFFAPYNRMLDEYKITYWPLLALLPFTMAVLSFAMAYILSLRTMVRDFRQTLMDRLAEFISPGLVHAVAAQDARRDVADGIPGGLGAVEAGNDLFRGRTADGTAVEVREIRQPAAADGGTGKRGVVCAARFGRRFRDFLLALPASDSLSLSGVAEKLTEAGFRLPLELVRVAPFDDWQMAVLSGGEETARALLSPEARERLAALCRERGLVARFSFRKATLWIALLSETAGGETGSPLDGFDFANSREFCQDAGICLDLAREIAGQPALWE